jgi:fructose-1,6-bisphosphatase-3
MVKKEKYDLRYLQSVAKRYPNIAAASTEIINLQAILTLPKGTEHFLTDIHGEYEQFQHVMKNGSGTIRRKIDDEFGNTLSTKEKRALASLIYYPEQKLKKIEATVDDLDDWYMVTLYRLISICKGAASKYTRSKVRRSLPKDFAYVIEELMVGRPDTTNKEAYYNAIIQTVIRVGRAKELVIAICNLIQRFVTDQLHIVGDIFDRGPGPHIVMETLMSHHSVDIQWGNHDVLWMGAAAGQEACIATVLRISAKYGNLNILEEGYGINLIPLVQLAEAVYGNDPCDCFKLSYREGEYNLQEANIDRKMHKAIAVIQFKLEGQLIRRHPEYEMEHRNLLHQIDFDKGTVTVEGKEYPMLDMNFPTIDPEDPYRLSPEEEGVMERIRTGFLNCEKLQRHIRFLYTNGSLYKTCNSNLMYHGCVPLNEDGTLKEVCIEGKKYKGKALYDFLDSHARKAYYSLDPVEKRKGMDYMWYTWTNGNSPVFGKAKMTTFERYFIEDKSTHVEEKNPYYSWYEKEETVDMILEEFGLPKEGSHIVNGHIPVEKGKGESPVKCNGRLLIIDGGFSKAYQPKTGIAGYTLIYNSYGLLLVAHEPFKSVELAVEEELDIHSDTVLVQQVARRQSVADTDDGKHIKEEIEELEALLRAFRDGRIRESE